MNDHQVNVEEHLFNPFQATGLFLYPRKTQKSSDFFMLLGGIERYQRYEIG